MKTKYGVITYEIGNAAKNFGCVMCSSPLLEKDVKDSGIRSSSNELGYFHINLSDGP